MEKIKIPKATAKRLPLYYRYLLILNEEGKDKLKKVKEIVSSFNYDRSDTMVDYYDRGFYDFYNCVVV